MRRQLPPQKYDPRSFVMGPFNSNAFDDPPHCGEIWHQSSTVLMARSVPLIDLDMRDLSTLLTVSNFTEKLIAKISASRSGHHFRDEAWRCACYEGRRTGPPVR